jgi:hypothetical protein
MSRVGPLALVALAVFLLPPLAGVTWIDPTVVLPVGSAAKLCFQLVAAVGAWRCAQALDSGDPPRRAWTLLASGITGLLLGQLVLARWQILDATMAPFPSAADAAFLPGTLLLGLGLADFARAYAASGMSVGSGRRAGITAILTGIGSLAAIALLLVDVLGSADSTAERVVAAAYPVLDVALLVPAVVLIDQTRHLRGGSLWSAWALLLAGAVAMATGDIAFAWFSVLDTRALEAVLDFAFASAYVLFAWGIAVHRANLAPAPLSR